MLHGTFEATYQGAFGHGIARFIAKNGEIFGSDAGGGQYFGTAELNDETGCYDIRMSLSLLFPNYLVTDGVVHSPNERFPICISVRPEQFGQPVTANLPMGPVTFVLRRIGDVPQVAA